MGRKETTVVETYVVKPPVRNPDGTTTSYPPKKLTPSPVLHVIGSHGSDEAKSAAKAKIRALGYTVTAISFTETTIRVHVSEATPSKRRPRSATRRLKR